MELKQQIKNMRQPFKHLLFDLFWFLQFDLFCSIKSIILRNYHNEQNKILINLLIINCRIYPNI